jgi:hypothetical protein
MPIVLRDDSAKAGNGANRPLSAPAARRMPPAAPELILDSPDKALPVRVAPQFAPAAPARVGASPAAPRSLHARRGSAPALSSPRAANAPARRASALDAKELSSRRGADGSRGGVAGARQKAVRPVSAGSARTARVQSQGPPTRPVTAAKDRVVVTVRKRPAKESEKDVVSVQDGKVLQVAEPRTKVDLTKYTELHKFSFDEVFDEDCSNEFIYSSRIQPCVDFVLQGGNGTCFAFGQTGSGKTFTMLGDADANVPGLMTLGAAELLQRWTAAGGGSQTEHHCAGHHVSVSMLEIYGDEVFDLLHASRSRKKLIPRDDASKKVRIQGLTRLIVGSVAEAMRAVDAGSALRCTSTTGMNEASSRSHAIVQICLHLPTPPRPSAMPVPLSAADGGVEPGEVYGSMSFVDLAGSEKGSDSASQDKQTRNEGAEINKSLLALKECIRAMDDPSSAFTPFRGACWRARVAHASPAAAGRRPP